MYLGRRQACSRGSCLRIRNFVLYEIHAYLAHIDDDGLGRVEDVLVYGGSILGEFFVGEAALMDDLHMFDYRRFS